MSISRIASRIGPRYGGIIDHFRHNPFGTAPQDMTVLSLLPPIDRVLILERVLARGYGDRVALIDKLSMAYVKSGYEEIPFSFLKACLDGGLLDENEYWFFVDKLQGLPIYGVSENYKDTLDKLPRYVCNGDALGDELAKLCHDYAGREIFAGITMLSPEEHIDRYAFDDERRGFIRLVAMRNFRMDAVGLWRVCVSGDIDTMKDMLPLGIDINCRLNPDGDTPLTKGIMSGRTEFAIWLIDSGADPVMSLHNGRTPLITAAGCGDVQVVVRLIRAGVPVDAQMNNGCSALMYAVAKGQIDVVRKLIAAGADKTIKDKDGWTIFDYAQKHGVDLSSIV